MTGYDGSGTTSANGFSATWPSGSDIPTLTVTPTSGSFTSFTGVIRQGGPTTRGGAVAATSNHSPVVTAPAAKTIPKQTPFTLTGSATDADSADTLTYTWEQADTGGTTGTVLTSNAKASGPLFRQFETAAQVTSTGTVAYHSPGENLAGTSPSRTFPDLAQVVAGNINAASGTCPAPLAAGTIPVTDPALNCFSEFLPTSARTMNFRLTARDEFSADASADHVGGLSVANVELTVDDTAGPFLVTSRASAGATASGAEPVTWDVAGTSAALASNVKISLSTDGGVTFPTVLAASTPNDGSETVSLPDLTTSTARLKIEAVGNYFFDVNDANFSITPAGTNTAPTVDAGAGASVVAGGTFTSSGTFNDDSPATVSGTVDYGDGSGSQALALNPGAKTFLLNHVYSTPATRPSQSR